VRRRAFLLLAVLAVAASGSAAVASPGAWRTVQVPAGRFAIDVPQAWVDVTGSQSQVVALLDKYPKLKPYADALVRNHELKLLSVDAASAGFATNVNVIVAPSEGLTDPRQVASAGAGQVKRSGLLVGPVSSGTVKLPAGTAPVLRYGLAIGGAVTATTQYFLIHGGNAYIVTYTTDRGHGAAYDGTFLRSARSIRFR